MGKDDIGILAKVSGACAKANASIDEVTQSILDDYYAMIMLVKIDKINVPFDEFRKLITESVPGMAVQVMHEDIFKSMHRV